MTDIEIIDHIRNEQYTEAFKGLYNMFPPAKNYIRTNSDNAEDAQDIFQDALVVLCRNIRAGNFTLISPLKSYLLAVVKNCWLQELRRRQKLPAGDVRFEPATENADEEQEFSAAEEAFRTLGEKCRQLLTLFYFHKKSFKDIATILAFGDENTAKNQKYRCLQKAKETYTIISKKGIHAI